MSDSAHSNPTVTVGSAELTALAALRELTRGQTVGRYLLLDKVGEGGMGAVWAAYDQELDRRVALKLLLTQATPSTSATQKQARLMREAQSLARLSHPNVVAIHDVFTWEGEVVVVMELVDGQNLRAWLRELPRSWEQVLAVFAAAGEGLAAAHQKGIVHRDFKPDNILVGADGRVKVADFGIARSLEEVSTSEVVTESHSSRPGATGSLLLTTPVTGPAEGTPATGSTARVELTQAGQVIGTPPYLAPELFRGEPASARSDQFSFGVSLFEALAGYRPFAGSLTERLAQIGKGELAPLPPTLKLPSFIVELVRRSVAASPASRFEDMATLLVALRKDPAQRRRRLMAGAAVVLALCAVGLGVQRAVAERRMLCTGGPSQLASVWNDGMRGRLASSFAATQVPYAKDALRLVNDTLDERGRQWVRTHRESCLASRVRGEQSDEMLSRRMACLDTRLEETRALLSLLGDIDAKVVERTAQMLDGLSPVSDCSDAKLLMAQVRPPATAAARKAVDVLRPEVADAWVLNYAGRYPQSSAKAQALEPRARALGYAPLEAEVALLLAGNAERLNDNRHSLDLCRRAVELAESAGDDLNVIRAANLLALTYMHAGNATSAREWLGVASAVIDRVGGAPEQQAITLAHLAGVMLDLDGNAAAAREPIEKALKIALAKLGRDHTTTYYVRDSYAVVLESLGQTPRAVEEQRSLIADMGARMGRSHPALSNPYNSLAEALMASGQYDAAKEALTHAQTLLQANAMEQAILQGYLLGGFAQIAMLQGDLDKFEAFSNASAAFFTRLSGPDFPLIPVMRAWAARARAQKGEPDAALAVLLGLKAKADARKGPSEQGSWSVYDALGTVERLTGQTAQAVEHETIALAALEKAGQGKGFDAAQILQALGRAQLGDGRASEARRTFEGERDIWMRLGGEGHPALAFSLSGMGEADLALGRLNEARRELETALPLFDPQPGVWQERASARLALARLVAAQDPPRATALARAAKAELVRLRRPAPALLRKAETFRAR